MCGKYIIIFILICLIIYTTNLENFSNVCNENSDKYYDNIKTYTTINNNHVKPTKNYNLIYGSEYQEDHDPKYF